MRFRVDFTLQNLFSPSHRQRSNLIAQLLPGLLLFLLDLCVGRRDDAVGFGLGLRFCCVDLRLCLLVVQRLHFCCLIARLAQHCCLGFFALRQSSLAFFGFGQSIGDFLPPLIHCTSQRLADVPVCQCE